MDEAFNIIDGGEPGSTSNSEILRSIDFHPGSSMFVLDSI